MTTLQDLYTDEVLRIDDSGSGAEIEFRLWNNRSSVTQIWVIDGGINYVEGDLCRVVDRNESCTFRVTRVDAGVVQEIELIEGGYEMNFYGLRVETAGGSGTGLTVDFRCSHYEIREVRILENGQGYYTAKASYPDELSHYWDQGRVIKKPDIDLIVTGGGVSGATINDPGLMPWLWWTGNVVVKGGPPATASEFTNLIREFDKDIQDERIKAILERIKSTHSLSKEMAAFIDAYPS